MTNLLGYLEETIKTHADKTAFAGENGSMTFGSIYEQARRIGSFWRKKKSGGNRSLYTCRRVRKK